jgi:hypothetical protein
MARLHTGGFELDAITKESQVTVGGTTPTINSSTTYGGSYAAETKTTSNGSSYIIIQFASNASVYARIYLNIT